MNDMVEMKEQHLAPFLERYFLWHNNIILYVYFKRHNCSNIVIQQQSYQTDLAHLPTRVSIPRKS